MKTTLCFKYVIFLLSITRFYTECQLRCRHYIQVGILPGVIKFYGNEGGGCQWTLNTRDFNKIQLSVLSTSFKSRNCSGSHLEVQDGTVFGRKITYICGQWKKTITSAGKYMHIKYKASPTYKKDRFELKYTAIDSSSCRGGYKRATSHDQFITSPYFPGRYPVYTECKYLLESDDSSGTVKLTVLESSIRGNDRLCTGDYVEAFDGTSSAAKSLGRWCGGTKPTKQSTGKYMFIKFHSDGFDTSTGYRMSYISVSVDMSSIRAGAIAGAVTAVSVFIVCMVCCIYLCTRKKSGYGAWSSNTRRRSAPSPVSNINIYNISSHVRRRSASLSSLSSLESESSPTGDLPPAYDDVVKDEPPSYIQAVCGVTTPTNQTFRSISNIDSINRTPLGQESPPTNQIYRSISNIDSILQGNSTIERELRGNRNYGFVADSRD